jgi:S1-C subfamily serine protease
MMRNRTAIGFVSLVLWTAAPSLFGQDFLKQLEQKLLQKKQEPAAETPAEETLPTPVPSQLSSEPLILSPTESEQTSDRMKPIPRSEPSSPNPPRVPTPAPKMPGNKSGATTPGYLGMTIEPSVGGGFGLNVVAVNSNSPAWKAGFRPGDKVVAVNGNAVATVDGFADLISQYSAGTPVKFLLDRQGKSMSLTAVLMDRNLASRVNGPSTVPPANGASDPLSVPINPGGSQAYFGVNVSDMSPAFRAQFSIPVYRGASVTEVIDGSPAQRAGLRPGDCIVAFKGKEIRNAEDVLNGILSSLPGETVVFSYYRGLAAKQGSATLSRADGLELATAQREITQEMLTADYVAELHQEIGRMSSELRSAQDRIKQLESTVRQLERLR